VPSDRGDEFSAGGVIVRDAREVAVVVPTRRAADRSKVLALPKGHPDDGESPVEAAAREVREEAGVSGELIEKLGDVRYWYQRSGRRILKVVSFYLFDYREGDVADHDDEIERASWMPLEEAAHALTYRGEREMVQRAIARLSGERRA
jgi:8-oxo-dGTP pyrophosphatase MutT (NUDIX family)